MSEKEKKVEIFHEDIHHRPANMKDGRSPPRGSSSILPIALTLAFIKGKGGILERADTVAKRKRVAVKRNVGARRIQW